MIKQIAGVVCMVSLGLAPLAMAEPISFEQAANVTGLTGIEVGANMDYSYQKVEEEGLPKTESTLMDVPVFVRVGLPIMEAKVSLPYGTVKNKVTEAQSGDSQSKDFAGVKDIGIMLKSAISLPVVSVGGGIDMTLPTGDPKKYLGEGVDAMPFVAASVDAMVLKVHANLGFKYRGDYQVEGIRYDPNTGETVVEQGIKVKPGNATHYAVGLELPAGDLLSLHAELVGDNYGAAAYDGNILDGSGGRTMSIVPGIRLHAGPLKAKIAYSIPVEKKDDRPSYAPSADWRILAGLSLQFSL